MPAQTSVIVVKVVILAMIVVGVSVGIGFFGYYLATIGGNVGYGGYCMDATQCGTTLQCVSNLCVCSSSTQYINKTCSKYFSILDHVL